MTAIAEQPVSPEWEQARTDWWKQAEGELARIQKAVNETGPGALSRAPVADGELITRTGSPKRSTSACSV